MLTQSTKSAPVSRSEKMEFEVSASSSEKNVKTFRAPYTSSKKVCVVSEETWRQRILHFGILGINRAKNLPCRRFMISFAFIATWLKQGIGVK